MHHNPVTAIRGELVVDNDGNRYHEFHHTIKRIADFGTPEGNLDEIIKRITEYVFKITGGDVLYTSKEPIDKDMVEKAREIIRNELKLWVSYLIIL